ncbi:hypothetical protein ACFYNO_01850 [Kitasatospora sp. NPDC006697]|uniref:hypothetical protein n=1 Tax=Kitasatospora sp. NPDC006697 TaxID=3364020 RepID=UPI0036C41691
MAVGFYGYLVLARTRESFAELFRLPSWTEEYLDDPATYADGWRVFRLRDHSHRELVPDGPVRAVAAITGSPVLVCQVYRSDYATLRGCVPGGELWRAEFNVELDLWDAVREEFGVREGEPEWEKCVEAVTVQWEAARAEVLAQVLAWAAAAGLEVDAAAVAAAVRNRWERQTEAAVYELFRSLGLGSQLSSA